MRFGKHDSKKYAKEYPMDLQEFESNSGANKSSNRLLSKISYEPFKKLFERINFADKLVELPERTQKVVNLILEGYNQSEIAIILNISIRTIKREYSLIKKWLKNGTIS